MASFLHHARSADRNHDPLASGHTPKLSLTTSLRSGSSWSRYNSPSPTTSPGTTRRADGNMSSFALASDSPRSPKQPGEHHKLHKHHRRSGSGPLPALASSSYTTVPFATYEEPHSSSSTKPRIKPYLRKMSSTKEDQGNIDLSKSVAENDRLAGLGIQDYASKSAADVSFAHTGRRGHGRTTSGASQVSNGSGRLGHPFTHPMTKTPRPYTPPAGRSHASSLIDDEANESDDIVEDEFRLGTGFRTKRSMSISSTPQVNPTPLSQSHTANDLGSMPRTTNTSTTNLSIRSDQSGKSKVGRSRGHTNQSDNANSSSSRTSFDRAFSLVGPRRSDPEPQSRDELIREARRKWAEKENKKQQKDSARRHGSQEAKVGGKRRKESDAPGKVALKPALKHTTSDTSTEKKRKTSSAATAMAGATSEREEVFARSYEDYRPANAAALPRYGTAPGESEKTGRIHYTARPAPDVRSDGGWMRFSTWVQTRVLSCGGGSRA